MIIQPKQKILFIGDSITDAGRSPGGEMTPWSPGTGLGRGYVSLFNALLTNFDPTLRIRVVNRGVSGNTILDLSDRWRTDVLDLEPDWLVVAIGVNDVWRQFDSPLSNDRLVTPEIYRETYRRLLSAARSECSVQGFALVKPFILEPNRAEPFRQHIDAYGDIVAGIAGEFDARIVDAQAALDRLMTTIHPSEIAWDRVHLNDVGHLALAQGVFEVLSE
jgi:lysophospholipase L1-like esterase